MSLSSFAFQIKGGLKINRNAFSVLLFIVLIISSIVVSFLFSEKNYMVIAFAIAISINGILLFSYSRKKDSAHKLALLACMTAFSVFGRLAFAGIPFFKPVTAIVIICGINLGAESGAVCGMMSAFLSNFLFTQGPWTPFQMLIWGLIGLFSGLLKDTLNEKPLLLYIWGGITGILFSLFMDIWTTLWWDSAFNSERYLALIIAALPVTLIYCVSNAVFLVLLAKPLGKKIHRIKVKYGIDIQFPENEEQEKTDSTE